MSDCATGLLRPPPGRLSYLAFHSSHRHVEGQGARLVHRQGQPLLSWCLWPSHEGGYTAPFGPADEQER